MPKPPQDTFEWLLAMETKRAVRYSHFFSFLPIKIEAETLDDLLRSRVIRHIESVLRDSDTLSPIGNDSVGIILPFAETPADQRIFNRIQERMKAFVTFESVPINLSTSDVDDDPGAAPVGARV